MAIHKCYMHVLICTLTYMNYQDIKYSLWLNVCAVDCTSLLELDPFCVIMQNKKFLVKWTTLVAEDG